MSRILLISAKLILSHHRCVHSADDGGGGAGGGGGADGNGNDDDNDDDDRFDVYGDYEYGETFGGVVIGNVDEEEEEKNGGGGGGGGGVEFEVTKEELLALISRESD